MDILPDRRCKTIENYFKQCDTGRGQVVVIDLSKRFKDSVRRAVGNSLYETRVLGAGYVRRETQRELKKKNVFYVKEVKKYYGNPRSS
jgi:transposase